MDDIASVNNLVESCKQTMPHTVRKHQDFIRDPKASGYRGHHIVWSFNGNGEDAPFDGLFVEMQVRTRLQHSWATAVEAVGLFLDEDLKASEGNEDWLRLFALMSAEFALTEMMPTHPSIPNTSARRLEIKNLEKKLDALSFLENLRIATEFVRTQITAFDRSSYFMLIYDRANQTVKVSPYTGVVRSASDFHREEMRISESHEDKKVVLVDVSGVESLADAYPNYFGDVAFFIRNLREVCLGKDAIEYSLVRQMAVASKKETPIDLSWFKRRHRWVE